MRKRIVAISRALVGKTVKEARKIAEENGSYLEIVEVDSVPVVYSDSEARGRDENRVSISVLDGKVARVLFLG